MKLKAGVKKDGTLTALQLSVTGTGGAFPAGGVSLVDWQVRDLLTRVPMFEPKQPTFTPIRDRLDRSGLQGILRDPGRWSKCSMHWPKK